MYWLIPHSKLHNGTGALIGSNDNWQNTIIGGIITQDQVQEILNSGRSPGHPLESAHHRKPPSQVITLRSFAVLSNTTGVGLVEVYDLQFRH